MKKNMFKKSMSIFLSMLMLMTCWVWVAPTEAEAATSSGSTTPSGWVVVYNGSGDRANNNYIVVCSDGEVGNTTCGVLQYNCNNITPLDDSYITLNVVCSSHGNNIKNAEVKVIPIDVSLYPDGAGVHKNTAQFSEIFKSESYLGPTPANDVYSYFGVTEADAVGTINQPSSTATSTLSFDVTEPVKEAIAQGKNPCFLFVMTEGYSNNNSTWSDTRIHSSSTISWSSISELKTAIGNFESKINGGKFYKNMSSAYEAYNNAKRYYDSVIYGNVAYNASVAQGYINLLNSALSSYNETYADYLNQTFYSRNGSAIPKDYTRNLIWNGYDFSWDITTSSAIWRIWNQFANYWAIPNTIIGITNDRPTTFPVTTFFFTSVNYHYMRYIIAGSGSNGNVVGTNVFSPASWRVSNSTHTTSGWPAGADGWGDWAYDSGVNSTRIPEYEVSSHTFKLAQNTIYQASTYMTVNNNNIGVNDSNIFNKTAFGMTWGISDGSTTNYANGYADNSAVNQGYVYAVYMEPYRANYRNWVNIIPNFTYKNYDGYAYSSAGAIAANLDSASSVNVNLPWNEATDRKTDISNSVSDWATRINNGANYLATAKNIAEGSSRITTKYNDLTVAIAAADSVYKNGKKKYTPASWSNFAAAYEAAADHMTSLDPNGLNRQYSTDDNEIGNLATNLANAQDALEYVTVKFMSYSGSVILKTLSAERDEICIGTTADELRAMAPENSETVRDASQHHNYFWPVFADVTDSIVYTETIQSNGHSWSEWETVSESTCSAAGLIKRECIECGYEATQTTALKSHIAGEPAIENVKEAQCDLPGSYDTVVRCTVCNAVISSTETITQMKGHSWNEGAFTVEPTCTTGGNKRYICNTCGKTKDEIVGSLGHTPGAAATCTTAQNCTVCGAEITAMLGHLDTDKNHVCDRGCGIAQGACSDSATDNDHLCDYGCGKVLEACSDKDNDKDHKCDVCGTDGITAHIKGEETRENVTEATCSAAGKYDSVYYCTECNAVMERTNDITIAQLPHSWGNVNYEWSTDGKTCTATRVCANNAEHNESETVNATGKKNVSETCETKGSTVYTAEFEATWADSQTTEIFDVPEKGHDMQLTEAKVEPECETPGKTAVYICENGCGKTEGGEEIAATGHNMVAGEVVTPTCEADGYTVYTCANNCGTIEHKDVVPTTGHSYSEAVTAPTCTDKGYTTHTCSKCGDSYVDSYVDALGHTEVTDEAVESDCENTGLTEGKHCSVCDKVLVKQEVVGALGHSYTSEVTAPTCTEKGYTTHICSRCSDSYVDSYVDAKGHTEASREENIVEATCGADGSYDLVTYCSVCKVTISTEEKTIPATGEHNYATEVEGSRIDATCKITGSVTMKCGCGATEIKTLPVDENNHADKVQVEAKAPTCTQAGYEAYEYCTACDYTTYKEVSATGHSYNKVVTAPTCTEKGYTTYTCACGDTYTADEVAATGHSYTSEITKAPTCTEKGTKTYTCSCGDTYTEDIQANGHSLKQVEAKAPTCTQAGYEAYEYCTACDYTTYKEVSATGHSYNKVVTAPTCTVKGYTTYTCACGDTYTADEVAATGHTEATREEDRVEASCGVDGSYNLVTYCSECNEVIKAESVKIPATGSHNYATEVEGSRIDATCKATGSVTMKCGCGATETVVLPIDDSNHVNKVQVEAKVPTCTETGYEAYEYCTACDYTTYKEVAASGHDMVSGEVVAPTCEADGYTVYTCSKGCGTTENRDVVAKKGHDYASEVTLEPTCNSQGIVTYTCKNDKSHTYMSTIPAVGHKDNNKDGYCDACGEYTCTHTDIVIVNVNPVTCEFDGYSGDTVCAQCGYMISKGKVVLAEGHTFGDTPVEIIPATCSTPKTMVYKCKKCTETEKKYEGSSDVAAHTIFVVEYIEPTCENDGYIYYVCMLCDSYIRVEQLSAKGHTDENHDGKCDDPNCLAASKPEDNSKCSCLCHNENAIMQFFYKIAKFFWKIFGMNKSCECGAEHY